MIDDILARDWFRHKPIEAKSSSSVPLTLSTLLLNGIGSRRILRHMVLKLESSDLLRSEL